MKSENLLPSIARCPEIPIALANASHPCAAIVSTQTGETRQVAEPWTGHIDSAPILFVSSNPGIHESEYFPDNAWTDPGISDYFTRRFDDDAPYTHQRPNGGAQYPKVYGTTGTPIVADHWVRFWSAVKNHASTLMGRKSIPGTDYAITEMVHCKSNSEYGVIGALSLCSRKWMPWILEESAAVIIVVLGKPAQSAASALWDVDTTRSVQFDVPINGQDRAVVLLPHTNYRGPRKIEQYVTPQELVRLRRQLSSGSVDYN